MSKLEHWQKQYQQFQEQIKPWERTSRSLSTWRIVLMSAALIAAIYADQSGNSLIYGLAFLCLIIFVWLVVRHQKITAQITMLQAKIKVTQKLCDRCDDTWRTKAHTGTAHQKTTNPLGDDLDLLGNQSLFQYLNFGVTSYGCERLSSLLLEGEREPRKILLRQDAIRELLTQPDWWMEFAGRIQCFKNDHHHHQESSFSDVKKQMTTFPAWFVWASFSLSFLIILFLLLGLFQVLPYGYAAILILFHLIVSFVIRHRCSEELASAVNYVSTLKDYRSLFACMKQGSFQNEILYDLQQATNQGWEGMNRLRRVMDLIGLRHNLFAVWIVGALFPIDVASVVCFAQWRTKYGSAVLSWCKAIGEMEALISLSVIALVKEQWCFAEFCEQKEMVLEVSKGIHPLIHEAKAIPNSMILHSGTYLITGSNMSGKTTFLRTLGTLSVLSKAGAPVCAAKMRTSFLQVLTSIRIRDDVNAGISTFYAELLRLKSIVDFSDQKQPMLVLIDEIFKGTNSADRILCAKTIIRKLHCPTIITIVSTHDFELCDLEADPAIMAHNYHFSENYQDDEIHFDYRLRDGRSTTTNALELLRMVGIEETLK